MAPTSLLLILIILSLTSTLSPSIGAVCTPISTPYNALIHEYLPPAGSARAVNSPAASPSPLTVPSPQSPSSQSVTSPSSVTISYSATPSSSPTPNYAPSLQSKNLPTYPYPTPKSAPSPQFAKPPSSSSPTLNSAPSSQVGKPPSSSSSSSPTPSQSPQSSSAPKSTASVLPPTPTSAPPPSKSSPPPMPSSPTNDKDSDNNSGSQATDKMIKTKTSGDKPETLAKVLDGSLQVICDKLPTPGLCMTALPAASKDDIKSIDLLGALELAINAIVIDARDARDKARSVSTSDRYYDPVNMCNRTMGSALRQSKEALLSLEKKNFLIASTMDVISHSIGVCQEGDPSPLTSNMVRLRKLHENACYILWKLEPRNIPAHLVGKV